MVGDSCHQTVVVFTPHVLNRPKAFENSHKLLKCLCCMKTCWVDSVALVVNSFYPNLLCCWLSAGEELNRVISEAFLSFFVTTVGHFASHVKRGGNGGQPGFFNKKSFCKATEPKANRHFVKLFAETQMFDIFIQEVEKHPNREGQRYPLAAIKLLF